MLNNLFMKTIRDQRRSLMWWGIGIAAYGFIMMLFYPSMQKSEAALEDYIEAFPEELMALFAGDISDFMSAEGFLNSELFFLMAPLVFLVFAIAMGSGAIAGEEE